MNLLAAGIVSLTLLAGDYFPPADARAGGIRDLMLIYLGKDSWPARDFLPYVAYLGNDAERRPRDWFYDSYLFLAFGGAPSGTTYISGPTTLADWRYYLDELLFCKGRALAGLEACLGDVERTLGPRAKVPVILMIPYPSREQRKFGDVDGDGRMEDLSQPADREKAVRWCVDEMLRRWKQAGLKRLVLWGFYWMNEGIGPTDEAIVRAAADHIHARGYGLHWIPYYRAPGCDKLPALGIDFAVLQPNYAFMEGSGMRPEEQRLGDTADLARRFGMGIEIEMTTLGGRAERENLWDYLTHGRDEFDGYMRRAVHAYYQGQDTIARLCYSPLAADRALYDALYQFAKGMYRGQRPRMTTGCRYRIQGPIVSEYPDDGRKLTDGLVVGDSAAAGRLIGLAGPTARIEVDLGQPRRIACAELRVATRGKQSPELPAAAACPKYFDVAVSDDGRQWRTVGRGYRWFASPAERITAGGMVAEFPACDARWIALSVNQVPGKLALVDELRVAPPESLTDNARCRLAPAPVAGDASGAALLDSCYAPAGTAAEGAVTWASGQQASLEVTLREPRHLGLLRVHMPRPGTDMRLDVLTRIDEAAAWTPLGRAVRRGNFLDLDAAATFAGQVKLVISGGPQVCLDELEIYPAENLALGKPYELRPAHPEKYGDPDRKLLTDGQVSERGFGDRRMVGWYGQTPEISIDLGQTTTVDAVRVHTQGGGAAAVDFPTRVDVLVSPDGHAWSWAATVAQPPEKLLLDRAHEHGRTQLGWMEAHFEPVAARFVMVRSAPRAWTMLSEIEVLAAGNNAARGRPYHLRPAPASAAPYADTTGKLTDGQYTTAGFSRSVGWNTGRPCVVVDLGLPVAVGEVAAHVVGGGPAGVRFPQKLSVATSLDGRQWTAEQVTTERPVENGQAAQATLRVQLAGPRCRYVRLEFQPRGWLMLDEVEVYGKSNRPSGN
jgi:hypothetical protein